MTTPFDAEWLEFDDDTRETKVTQGGPTFTLTDLTNEQLRDLILQAFGQLALNEQVSLLEIVQECYDEVRQETEHGDD